MQVVPQLDWKNMTALCQPGTTTSTAFASNTGNLTDFGSAWTPRLRRATFRHKLVQMKTSMQVWPPGKASGGSHESILVPILFRPSHRHVQGWLDDVFLNRPGKPFLIQVLHMCIPIDSQFPFRSILAREEMILNWFKLTLCRALDEFVHQLPHLLWLQGHLV